MSWVDDLLARIAQSGKLDATGKAIVAEFVEASRAVLEAAGAETARDLIRGVVGGEKMDWDQVVRTMDQDQLAALLGAVEGQMAAQAAAAEQLRAFERSITEVGLRLLGSVVVGML